MSNDEGEVGGAAGSHGANDKAGPWGGAPSSSPAYRLATCVRGGVVRCSHAPRSEAHRYHMGSSPELRGNNEPSVRCQVPSVTGKAPELHSSHAQRLFRSTEADVSRLAGPTGAWQGHTACAYGAATARIPCGCGKDMADSYLQCRRRLIRSGRRARCPTSGPERSMFALSNTNRPGRLNLDLKLWKQGAPEPP